MRFFPARAALALVLGASVLSCKDTPLAVKAPSATQFLIADGNPWPTPAIVISEIYGGGGNSGATYKNDFVELFNPGSQTVRLTGWSIQYASAAGSFTQVTNLRDSILPGGYYLVQEAAGAGGTTSLPAPDATGSIAMAAGSGKVALLNSTTALGACPLGNAQGTQPVDLVSYGAGTNCGNFTTTLTNRTAAFRKDAGCAFTNNPTTDFDTLPAAPRSAATARHVCPGALPVGPLDHVLLADAATVTLGSTIQLSATPQDANGQTVSTATLSWSSSDPTIASVDATGKVTGVAPSATAVTITATAVDGNITKSKSVQVTVNTPNINWVDISASSTAFPPGFQAQIFATARVSDGGTVIPATFTFEPVDPQIATVATVQNTGLVTGIAAPADPTVRPGFRVSATPVGGGPTYSFVTHVILIQPPVSAPTSIYAVNDEFGDPTAASTSNPNDLLIRRAQYTLSYNESRGTPNWVSYELDARQMVAGQDRCNCFTADPLLPSDKQILTSDYTNGGFDRGHMTRSADRTAANVDNASTFYLTNVVPQQGDLNQGVWAQFENALADSANLGGRAVYIITGPLYSRSHGLTFLKNEGKVAIPDSTWKVALIGPRASGNPFTRGSIQSWDDLAALTVLAVNMPNVSGVRNDPWATYLTTVSKIEQSTGYDFLSLLQSAFQSALEAGDHAPSARLAVNGSPNEGTVLTFDASASSDPDLGRTDLGRTEALLYSWQFSDGTAASGPVATKTFARYGSYTATLTVTDAFGWQSTATRGLTIGDVAPTVAPLPGAGLIAGETYGATGSYADPGTESWTATVDYGDGAGQQPLSLNGKTFALVHSYGTAGTFTITVTVQDDGGVSGSATTKVTVQSPLAATQTVALNVQTLAGTGAISRQETNPLLASLNAAEKQMERGNYTPAANELDAFLNKLDAAVRSGRLAPDVAQPLTATVQRIEAVLRP
jgi:DNA/RNA endonuclease G (NUC1)